MTDVDKPKGFRNNFYMKAFLLGLGLSFLVFIPYIIRDGGRFLFYGDFNVQQVPFYRIAHDAVASGNFGWSHLTDLGSNFIGSYSFYLLGSPFFWLTIPFPGEWLQYLMGPLLILKFACATLTASIFLRRYVKNQSYAIIGALLYAFSGFSVYNIFFNHFHEAIVFFPLLLAALDEYMENRRRGLFCLAVFACCFVNYYFFVGQVVLCLIYFFIRLLCGSYRIKIRDFLLLMLEAVLGLLMSSIILIPSVFAILQNSRVTNPINGWDALVYNKPQRYLHILECFFFPPDLPARPNFTPESESKWASLGAWLPLFSMSGVIGWLQLRRKHWLKKLLYVLLLCAFVPGLNSAFQMFNGSYYARWFYMITLFMALATVMALENEKTDWKRSIRWTAVVTLVFAVAIGAMPDVVTTDGVDKTVIGLEKYPTRFWSYVAISLICLAVLVFLFRYCNRSRSQFMRGVLAALSVIAVLYSSFFIALGKTQSLDPYDHMIPYALNGGKDVPLEDLDTVRSDFYESLDNSAMFWKVPSIQAFHSIVPGSVMEFYKYIGVERNVASRPEVSHYGLRGLTSVKWLFDDDHDEEYFAGKEYDTPAMPDWDYYGNANGFDIWENQNYIPMGFAYDSYLTESEAKDVQQSNRELLMLKTAIIPDEDEALWQETLPKFDLKKAVYSKEEYAKDCQARSAVSSETFGYTNNGFEATIHSNRDQVIFFSVPYEDGWRAAVNGEPVKILKTNVGFMSVQVPDGEEVRISFTYLTPGLPLGITVTVLSILVLCGYLYLMGRLKKKEQKDGKNRNFSKRRCRSFQSYGAAKGVTFKKKNELGYLRSRF